MEAFDRQMKARDIAVELGIGLRAASAFLQKYGTKCGGVCVISQRSFRHLQVDGTAAQWLKARSTQPHGSAHIKRLEKVIDECVR